MFALQAAYPAASSQPRTNVGKQLLCLQPLSSFHFRPEVINFHFSGKKKNNRTKITQSFNYLLNSAGFFFLSFFFFVSHIAVLGGFATTAVNSAC